MPNANRARGGVAYYCIPSSRFNFLCHRIDDQIPAHLQDIQIDGRWIPKLRRAFADDVEKLTGANAFDERTFLQECLKEIETEEARTARLYAMDRITDEVWNTLWNEWQDRRDAIRRILNNLDQNRHVHLANLDTALSVITKLGILYEKVNQETQRDLLRHVIRRVLINPEGQIIEVELRIPFTYLHSLLNGVTSSPISESLRVHQIVVRIGKQKPAILKRRLVRQTA